jgi:hypothetical protein
MRKFVCNLVTAAALLLVPLAASGGDFGCCQRGDECINGSGNLFMTCPLTGGVLQREASAAARRSVSVARRRTIWAAASAGPNA